MFFVEFSYYSFQGIHSPQYFTDKLNHGSDLNGNYSSATGRFFLLILYYF